MSNENKNDYSIFEDMQIDDTVDFDDLEEKLQDRLDARLEELNFLEKEKAKIGSPESLGETIQEVVWEQFCNQIGVEAGKEFIEENKGMTLDLRDEAHIQTAENFAAGKIAKHNTISGKQLEANYDRYKNVPHKEFRKEYVDPKMDEVLPRAGKLNKQGIDKVKDIYTGRDIPTATKLEDGSNNPLAAQREHVKPSAEVYKDPSLQMAYGNEELAGVINNPENLQGYTTAERNIRKSDSKPDEMEVKDKTKHWEKANERAEKHIEKKQKEGEDRLRKEGLQTQEKEAFRIGKEGLKAVFMQLFASLIKNIIAKLIKWFKEANRKLSTFIASVKDAIMDFVHNFKKHLVTATDTLLTTIATAIWGPVVGVIKKVWIFLKQGWKSLKDAVSYIKNPEHRKQPIGILIAEVGKIVIAGLSAAGAIVLGEVISKALMTIPVMAIEIPLLGSIASLIGIFMGGVVSGIIGAIAINKIDKYVSKRLKNEQTKKQIEAGNKTLALQESMRIVAEAKKEEIKSTTTANIKKRHQTAVDIAKEITEKIHAKDEHSEKFADKINEAEDLLSQL